jgi:hypothetical protein
MTAEELARSLGISPKTLRAWLRRTGMRSRAEAGQPWVLDQQQVSAATAHFGGRIRSGPITGPTTTASRDRDELYVVDLCDEVLGEQARRQCCFPWLVGDPGKAGGRRALPVDAYYEGHGLVVEYQERQHTEPTPFFDRRQTVSGVGRGEQRSLYDQRREAEIPAHGLRLVVVRPRDLDADSRGRLRRNRTHDRQALSTLLAPPSP